MKAWVSPKKRLGWMRDSLHATLDLRPQTLPAFHAALAFYDRASASHCARVSRLSVRLGSALGLDGGDLEVLRWSALLHDLGKLSFREAILRSQEPLTEDDRAQIISHPSVGADIVLAVSQGFEPIASAIRSHHERWDGSGYPAGLAGATIPLAARIIAIADTWDAMSTPRSYRSRDWTRNEVVDHLETQAHRLFDPRIVSVFIAIRHDSPATRTM
jgi:putative nucleotidyltransferase with HDIG domain